MSTYVTITEQEMDSLLRAEKGWIKSSTRSGGGEFVYEYPIKANPDIHVLVYSSIQKNGGKGRGVGQDAIRVCAADIMKDRGLRKSQRIHRTGNWQSRVKARVIEMIADLTKQLSR